MAKLSDALLRRLRVDTELDDDDVRAIEQLPIIEKGLSAGAAVVSQGERSSQSCLLIDGFLIRTKSTSNGKRQILSVHVPGDIPDLMSLHLPVMDHDLSALHPSRVGLIPHDDIKRLNLARPTVAAALWRETLIDAAIFREHIFRIGQRPAKIRLAQFLLEQGTRLAAVGLGERQSFFLPMTQVDLAEACGMTSVHVNRVMMELRREGLLDMKRHVVTVLDLPKLLELTDFDELYLHQNPRL